jgi:antitoxin CptB
MPDRCSPIGGFNRLAWHCRRGLLELDLWLGGFLHASRATLQPEELAAFERLLAMTDMCILDFLQQKTQPGDADIRALVERIRIERLPITESPR